MDTLDGLIEELEKTNDETPIYPRIVALAAADLDAFLLAYDALGIDAARGDVLEAFTLGETYDPAWTPIIDHALGHAIGAITAASDPNVAALAALGVWPLAELDIEKIGEGLADRLYDRVVPLLAHPEPQVRMTFLELAACWSRPGRIGSRDPIATLLARDPDPKVRDVAYRALAEHEALPPGAARPWSPDSFRSIRRWFASL